MPKIHNFNAGPSILPQEVFQQAAEAVLNLNNIGLSILEISHRSKDFDAIMDKAVALVKKLYNVPDGYSVLFLQGGASLQFSMIPMNLLSVGGKAAFLKTGTWANKAIKEAKFVGDTVVVASSDDKNYNYIPKNYVIPADVDYFHVTSNNTIFGTQMREFLDSPVPMVADMSSDVFSHPIDVSKFGLIYAGAQKNMGPAGVTLVIVKDELLGKTGRNIPTILDYRSHIEANSMYNTSPVFPIYVAMLTLQWLDNLGGLEEIAKRNQAKAELLYNALDQSKLFKAVVSNKEDRSYMNVTFVLNDSSLDDEFMKLAKQANLIGLKGHRSVGGFRASIYNAMDISSVQALVDVIHEFEQAKA